MQTTRPQSYDIGSGRSSPAPSHPRSPLYRPTLQDVLNNLSPAPYNLGAFERFLKSQHCVENLYFTLAIAAYREQHDLLNNIRCAQWTARERRMLKATQQRWRDLMDKFVSSKASHQVNIPGKVREALMEEDRYVEKDDPPPEPEILEGAESSVMEMLRDIFPNFLERASTSPYLNKAPSWALESDSGRGTPTSGSANQSCPGSPSMSSTSIPMSTTSVQMRKEYTSAGMVERPVSSERSRSGSGGSDPRDELRKPQKISFYKQLAATTASIIRVSSNDKLKVSPGSSGRNSVRTSMDRDSLTDIYEEPESRSARRGGFFGRR